METEMTIVRETPATVEAAYTAVSDLIFHQVYKFKRTYGGDIEDLMGEAHVAFMRGHRACEKGENTDPVYSTEIRRWVWYLLFDALRVRLERKRKVKFSTTEGKEEVFAEPEVSTFDRDGFMATLSEDARYAAGLVLNTPPALDKVARGKGGSARNYKSTVREYLKAPQLCPPRLGWKQERVIAAFNEITEVLGGR